MGRPTVWRKERKGAVRVDSKEEEAKGIETDHIGNGNRSRPATRCRRKGIVGVAAEEERRVSEQKSREADTP